ncbi:hypothetical protein SSX86_033081 [Deinandra increscens subsp. villosa]|uniref:Pyruvate phosphate dikinase AMP/ATP-binding domain-containing protein n=1 Tax=Deinandra increscens subsp. villosa TaxID=3103831 RepID=A0AAP0C5Y6_9ASTR
MLPTSPARGSAWGPVHRSLSLAFITYSSMKSILVPMDEEEKVVLDYSSDPLMTDGSFQKSILSSIARAGDAIEKLYGGSPQDIEGVVRDGKIYVVQTRPQM